MHAVLAAATAALIPFSSTPGADRLLQLRPGAVCTEAVGIVEAGGVLAVPTLRVYRVDATTARVIVPALRRRGALQHVSVNRTLGTVTVTRTGADPMSDQEWWRSAVGIDGLTPPGPGRPITVVDSGVDLTHPEFVNRPNTSTLNAQEPAPLGGEHGTMVSSLIGAPENGVGVVGIYPQADLRIWDAAQGAGTQLSTEGIVEGILAASRQGPGVVNLSLGGSRDPLIDQAVNVAITRGVLVVAASGNDGERGSELGYPAALPHVTTVAATDATGRVASFSSRSPYVDLAAPGDGILVASALGKNWLRASGTSFSSPLVAGAAAWIWTARPELSADQLAEILRRSARDIDAPGRDPASGFGMLNVAAALAMPAPLRDPFEPNDDIDEASPDGDRYVSGAPSLTTPTRQRTRVAGRVDLHEDARDVYRVWLPANRTFVATLRASADGDLALFGPSAPSVTGRFATAGRLATASTRGTVERLGFRNRARGRWAYVVVQPAPGTIDATYRLELAATTR